MLQIIFKQLFIGLLQCTSATLRKPVHALFSFGIHSNNSKSNSNSSNIQAM